MTAEQDCFCELAPFYALDVLSQSEREWVNQQLAECPELAEELMRYEEAVAAIPYSAPDVLMPQDLKGRLFNRLDLELSEPELSEPKLTPTSALESALSHFLTVRSQDLEWKPHDTPGFEIAIFHTDSIRREVAGVLRAEPRMYYPSHRHASVEEIYMLSGELIAEDGVYRAGDYLRCEPNSVHAPFTTGAEGCMFFFRTSMDDEYPERLEAAVC